MQSQSPRSEMSRRNMSSRRSGLGKGPKLLILLAVTAGLIFFFWGGDDADSAAPGNNIVDAAPPSPQDLPADLNRLAGLDIPTSNADNSSTAATETAPPQPEPPSVVEPEPEPVAEVQPDPNVAEAARDMVTVVPVPREFTSGADAATLYNRGDALIADGDPIAGRTLLSRALFANDIQLSRRDAETIRERLDQVNADLIWSRDVYEGDPICRRYKNNGEFLSQIGVKHRVPYGLLEIINNMDARNLQADQVIKVIQGPLHARVTKHTFIMDIYALTPDGQPIYVTHFPVGLGKNTPLGNWQVTRASKVENPSWRDELNGEFFPSNDPNNPVGEYWIAIHGLDEANKNKRGFGIHGTIEPDSIGKEESRGCIRLRDDDIEFVFKILTDHSQGSTVQIVP